MEIVTVMMYCCTHIENLNMYTHTAILKHRSVQNNSNFNGHPYPGYVCVLCFLSRSESHEYRQPMLPWARFLERGSEYVYVNRVNQRDIH